MTTSSLERTALDLFCDMEGNQDCMRILCDLAQDILSTWHISDTAKQNSRMNEQLFVLLNSLQVNLRGYNDLLNEGLATLPAKP